MRLLIIEDEIEIAHFLKENLEAEYYSVDYALDGEQGSWLARTNHYDLVILDYMLPKLLGPEVCREIKADKKDLPIIMLTVKPELESKLELFDLGIDDYITKPFLLVELIVRIKAILQRPKICQEKIIKWENITINLNNYSVWVDKKEIYLTKREFSLLRCLITNADRVLSRDEIFDRVWDMNADCFSNTVETHILNLRKKLETKGRKLIHNVSGRGYIIKDKLFHVQG